MRVIVVSVNYQTAPVEIREKLAFSEEKLADAMKMLNQQKSVLENVIVSTCNRTEIYAVVDQLHTGRYYIKSFLANWFSMDLEEVASYVSIHEEEKAIMHLFRVTCGLESMVLGETQILGQVKQAFLVAQEQQVSGTIFNQLFKQAITVAKRSHKETEIGENAVSVSYAAVELSKKIFGDLSNKRVAILGAGKMGELAVKNLHGSGVQNISVINRTRSKAEEVASKIHGQAYSMDELEHVLSTVDILISSTGAEGYVLSKSSIEKTLKARKGRPLFLMDIAVPRDLDPSINDLDSVFLYDIDDLQGIVDANLESRKEIAQEIESMIAIEMADFAEWVRTLGVVPVISALRQKALLIQQDTMESIERKMPDLSDRERKVLSKHTKSIINQLLKEPILQAKELAGQKNADETLDLFMKIFGIEEEVKQELDKQSEKSQHTLPSDAKGKLSFPTIRKSSIHS
ncbi:glutamyl-tRNA reductase [Salirhabdus euzebyi]|uniref:Glutamyl-tRNA reductase n=1 Tax=Salirhabdus euzebyi TaxID=394506 RepID=A0A841PX25_9BACI|nr:glutamyl-tRNA reductase [Salirhabdus euzebyi]MBB6451936.1 glutamyl-tRNA reductase [Salirhabdus euzebyi]